MSGMRTSETGLEALLGQAGWLRALALSLLHSGPDAEDAVQDVWTAALRSPPDGARPPRPWLAQVLRNVVRSDAREARRRQRREDESAGLSSREAAPAADGVLERMQLHRRVAGLVMALEEPYRTTLLLRFYEGRAAVDIAREEGLPDGTVRWRINEGLRRLRERLDADFGGERARWSRALLPLAGLDRPPPLARPPGLGRAPLLAGATAVTAALGVAAVWLVQAHGRRSPGAGDAAFFGHGHAALLDPASSPRPTTPNEGEIMKRQRLKQAAVFFGVVLPALGARADDATLEETVISACVEMNEKSYECRDEFVDATLELRLGHSGTTVTPEQRAKMREKAMRDLTERATGPLERRRAWCKKLLDQMGPRAKQGASEKRSTLKACYAETDCKTRVACIMPIIAEIHGPELKHPPKP
jgi:RNA polymerase sigma-70 factor (ECF subfamily)